MSAPVNPEGQTARDLTDEEIANGEQWIAALTTGPVRYPEMKIDCSLLARLLAEAKRRRAVRPSEGQTAQEVRQRAEALWIALNRPAMTSNKGIDLIVRALASTPSPIQTQSTKEQHEEGRQGEADQGGDRSAREDVVRKDMPDARPSSPEEQLSEGATTKKEG